jgi:hypothetical protein
MNSAAQRTQGQKSSVALIRDSSDPVARNRNAYSLARSACRSPR